jgi:hypothetical protein
MYRVRGMGDAVPAGQKDCGCGSTVPIGGTCADPIDPVTGLTAGCKSWAELSATPGACPAGYGVPTFNDGLQSALKGLPYSILSGLTYLPSIGQSNTGNVLGPDGVSTCQTNRNSAAFVIGMALPGLAIVGAVAWWMFGGGRGR